MTKPFRTYLPEQDLLLPPSLREWLPDDRLAYFVSDVVDQLDLSAIESVYEEEERGQPPVSSADDDQDPGLWVLRGSIFVAQDPEAIGGGRSFSSVGSGEPAGLPHHFGFPEASSEGAGRDVPADVTADVRDGDDEIGAGSTGREQGGRPAQAAQSHELWTDEGNREATAGGSAEVVEPSRGGRAQKKRIAVTGGIGGATSCRKSCSGGKRGSHGYGKPNERWKSEPGSKPSEGKDAEKAQPTPQAQYSFTDPESRILKGAEGFVQGYNTQIAVEPVFQLIVGQTVTQAANDKQQMVPLIEAIEEQCGQKPEEVVADSGYCSDQNLKYLARRRIEGFVATGKQKHSERRKACKRGPLPRAASRVERMERKLETKVGAAVYATRKFIVEPVFGQIKQGRGFRQFLLRGLEKVRGEWALICLTHNLLKFHKICYG